MDLQGTKAPITKPQSIIEFVKRMNHLLRVPDFSSPLDSAQLTLPAGYSPIYTVCTNSIQRALRLLTSDADADLRTLLE